MPTRVLLEGPEIEPLLEQVRDQYGSAARIVNAEKVRVGGVGGFFAREYFELSVEVPDELAPAPTPPSAGAPSSDATSGGTLSSGAAPAGPAAGAPAPGDATPAAPRSLDDLLHLAEAQDGQPATDPLVRPTATPAPAAATPTATPATPTATPAMPTATAATPTATRAGAAGAATGAAAASTAPRVVPAAGLPLKRPVRSTGAVPRAALASTTGAAFAEVMAGINAATGTPATQSPATEPAATLAVRQPSAPAVPTRAPLVARLVDLGVPEPLATRVTGADPYQDVLDALAALPAPPRPPSRAGDVLVLAGELAHALPIARDVAQGLHLDPAKILLAAPTTGGTGLHASRRISGPAEAHRRARTLHRAEVPHVVVVDAPITGSDDGWVRSICDALGATALWAAVDATRKLADTARHLQLMGRVDAMAVYATGVCSDPGAVLALDVPVALLERRPATPAAWATLLTERLRGRVAQLERMELTRAAH